MRQLVEQPGGALQAEQLERLALEIAAPPFADQLDELQVRVHVRTLELPVERVDERLHLLPDARSEPSAC